jgi:hypothetical protein
MFQRVYISLYLYFTASILFVAASLSSSLCPLCLYLLVHPIKMPIDVPIIYAGVYLPGTS